MHVWLTVCHIYMYDIPVSQSCSRVTNWQVRVRVTKKRHSSPSPEFKYYNSGPEPPSPSPSPSHQKTGLESESRVQVLQLWFLTPLNSETGNIIKSTLYISLVQRVVNIQDFLKHFKSTHLLSLFVSAVPKVTANEVTLLPIALSLLGKLAGIVCYAEVGRFISTSTELNITFSLGGLAGNVYHIIAEVYKSLT